MNDWQVNKGLTPSEGGDPWNEGQDGKAKIHNPFRKGWVRVFRLRIFLFIFMILHVLNSPSYPAPKESLRRSPVVVAVERVSPAVVNISTIVKERVSGSLFPFSADEFFKDFFPDLFAREYTHTSLGSGLVIDGTNGYIVTNHHVVARASEIKVITASKEEFNAKIVGSDPRSDLAVLKAETQKRLPEIAMGDSENLMIGETVIAIGNPFGLSHTVTTGVVSALERSVRSGDQVYRHFIQTDASINPGNSGGPLLNIEGEVIGINTAIYQKAQGIGFAIPANKAKRIFRELIHAGEVRFPWLGLEMQDLTNELRGHFSLSSGKEGVLVSDVNSGGPADRAGVKRGDILMELEGTPVGSLSDYREALSDFTSSDLIRIRVFRTGKEITIPVQPAIFPAELALDLVERRLGIRVAELDDTSRRRYGIEGGLNIENVRQGSEAGRIGLQRGDLILKVHDVQIKGLKDLKRAISNYHHLPSLTMIVQRGHVAYSLTLPF